MSSIIYQGVLQGLVLTVYGLALPIQSMRR